MTFSVLFEITVSALTSRRNFRTTKVKGSFITFLLKWKANSTNLSGILTSCDVTESRNSNMSEEHPQFWVFTWNYLLPSKALKDLPTYSSHKFIKIFILCINRFMEDKNCKEEHTTCLKAVILQTWRDIFDSLQLYSMGRHEISWRIFCPTEPQNILWNGKELNKNWKFEEE